MAVSTVRRIDEAYRDDDLDFIPSLELMGGPKRIQSPPFYLNAERHFRKLATRWSEETRYMSSLHDIINHEAYQEIIKMGRVAILLILKELEQPDPDHWGPALNAITGEQPVPEENAGCLDKIADAWLSWARDK